MPADRRTPSPTATDVRQSFEDAIISHTFVEYLQTGGAATGRCIPMVKDTVKAMDVAQEIAKKELKIDIENCAVTGRIETRLDDLAYRFD